MCVNFINLPVRFWYFVCTFFVCICMLKWTALLVIGGGWNVFHLVPDIWITAHISDFELLLCWLSNKRNCCQTSEPISALLSNIKNTDIIFLCQKSEELSHKNCDKCGDMLDAAVQDVVNQLREIKSLKDITLIYCTCWMLNAPSTHYCSFCVNWKLCWWITRLVRDHYKAKKSNQKLTRTLRIIFRGPRTSKVNIIVT